MGHPVYFAMQKVQKLHKLLNIADLQPPDAIQRKKHPVKPTSKKYQFYFQMLDKSLNFLSHTKKFLDNWVELGHDTCHRTFGYDAEKCHQDCKKKEKSVFAKQCRKDGGLFKCCIR